MEFEVKWVGEEEHTWEPLENLTHAEEALADFKKREEEGLTQELGKEKALRRSGRKRRQRILNLLHGTILAEHDNGRDFIVSRDSGEVFIISMGKS